MTATDTSLAAQTLPDTPPPTRPRRFGGRGRLSRWIILLVAAIYFLGPLAASFSFTIKDPHGGVTFSAYKEIFKANSGGESLSGSLLYSLEIAVVTIVLSMTLMLPTQLLLHLRLPRWRGIVEIITLLPLVFPPVVLVVGVSDVYKQVQPSGTSAGGTVFDILRWVREGGHPLLLALLYVVLTLPFVYRSLDAGIRSVDVHTLVEAARNLGAGWMTVVLRVLMPCLRTSIVNASFLCFALVMGEYTIASILLYTKPFPVWLAQLPTQDDQVQVAVSLVSLVLVEVILLAVSALNTRTNRQRRT